MNTIQKNKFPVFIDSLDTKSSANKDSSILALIKEDIETGLTILHYNHGCSKNYIIEGYRKSITSLLRLLSSNHIINSKLDITGRFNNCDSNPENKDIDKITSHGYTISYNGRDLVKITFIDKIQLNPFEAGYSHMPDFTIKCYGGFYNMCREVQINTPRLKDHNDADFFLEQDDDRKTKKEHTKEFDAEIPQRSVYKSYKNSNIVEKLIDESTSTVRKRKVTTAKNTHDMEELPRRFSREYPIGILV